MVILGVTQEQHPERCRLFAQWKQFDFPILHDPINILEATAVPLATAIDEHGIVRLTRANARTIEADFLKKTYAADATNAPTRFGPKLPIDWPKLKDSNKHRDFGDALLLWGQPEQVNDAIANYQSAIKMDAKDGYAHFRLGVAYRRRYESRFRDPDDFQNAIQSWSEALRIDPNQYIWRRRIQQYGPRLDKPYPFYDWVPQAEEAIRERGDTPIALPVRPEGAEIARPQRQFAEATQKEVNPDPDGKIKRIDENIIDCEVTVVPGTPPKSNTMRVHLIFRLNPASKHHWNNEAEAMQIWLDLPQGTASEQKLYQLPIPKTATSDENRRVEFEIRGDDLGKKEFQVKSYALFHICDDVNGLCRFVRIDVPFTIRVKK